MRKKNIKTGNNAAGIMLIIGRTLREIFKLNEVVVYIDDKNAGIAARYRIIK